MTLSYLQNRRGGPVFATFSGFFSKKIDFWATTWSQDLGEFVKRPPENYGKRVEHRPLNHNDELVTIYTFLCQTWLILGQLDVAELFFNTFMDLKGIAETLDGRKVDFFGKSELQFGSKSSISKIQCFDS